MGNVLIEGRNTRRKAKGKPMCEGENSLKQSRNLEQTIARRIYSELWRVIKSAH